ncbi:hypothetical protein Efla_005481 [Eimeria flavescens]
MASTRPQLPDALPSAELFPAQPSGPERAPAASSNLPSGHHSLSHPYLGIRKPVRQIPSSLCDSPSCRRHRALVARAPHCRAALTRLQHLRSTDNIPLGEIEEAGIREDEADFLPVFPAAEPPFFSKNRNRRNSSPQATKALVVFAVSHTCGRNAQRRGALAARLVVGHVRAPAVALKAFHSGSAVEPSHEHMEEMPFQIPASQRRISSQVTKSNSLISSPKQLVSEGTVNKNPITFLLEGGADHSIMSRAFALTNGIIMQPLDPPIATVFASNSSEVIRFATEPLRLQCQGHRSFVRPLVSNGVLLDLLLGLDWLQKKRQRVD